VTPVGDLVRYCLGNMHVVSFRGVHPSKWSTYLLDGPVFKESKHICVRTQPAETANAECDDFSI
ncbi:MAG TPA: hypothetical protein PKN69_03905, partial [Candidatus Latescibacteria bacterium]|nr:hypothetical protein [Candidatus Latescibacterota bacterium]